MSEQISNLVHYNCPNCNAEVELPRSLFSTKCAFCDSPVVLSEKQHEHQIDLLLPFLITKKQAALKLQQYLQSKYFIPKLLKEKTRPDELDGVFIPFWVYQAKAFSEYSAQVGIHWYETVVVSTTDSQGRRKTETRREQRTEWFTHTGTHVKQYDDHLVCASKAITEEESNSIEPFDCGLALQFTAELVAGWLAENPVLDKETAFSTALDEIHQQEYRAISTFLTGDTKSNLTHETRIEVQQDQIQAALLPIWIAVYHHKGEPVRLLVNGQTGKVNGLVPRDWLKIAILTLIIITLLMGFGLILYFLGER